MKAERLPFADGEFDVAAAIEALEHVPDPEHTVAEMARVASGHLLVLRPPRARVADDNMARGAYLRDLGNTPGHLNHWSKAAFVSCCRATARSSRLARRSRGPCCLSASSGLHGASAATARRSCSPSAWRRPALVTFAYFSVAVRTSLDDEATTSEIALLWSVMFMTVTVIYRPMEQLLSRTIADRRASRAEHDHPIRTPLLDPGGRSPLASC